MSLNKVLPINKVCLTKDGVFKPYARIHIAKGRAMATNGRTIVVWNLKKLQQVGENDVEEEVLTEEVIEFLEGKSITAQYWESLIKAKEVYVVKDGEESKLEIIQDGRSFVLEYLQPSVKEIYTEQISSMIKAEKEVSSTEKSCILWSELETAKKALAISSTTKVNMVFNGENNSVKIIPENGYDCFAVCQSVNNETNMFILEEFNSFVEDFLTVGDTYGVRLGKVEEEPKDEEEVESDEQQTDMFEEETENKSDVLQIVEDEDNDDLPL